MSNFPASYGKAPYDDDSAQVEAFNEQIEDAADAIWFSVADDAQKAWRFVFDHIQDPAALLGEVLAAVAARDCVTSFERRLNDLFEPHIRTAAKDAAEAKLGYSVN